MFVIIYDCESEAIDRLFAQILINLMQTVFIAVFIMFLTMMMFFLIHLMNCLRILIILRILLLKSCFIILSAIKEIIFKKMIIMIFKTLLCLLSLRSFLM